MFNHLSSCVTKMLQCKKLDIEIASKPYNEFLNYVE